jgi:integrase
MSTRPPGLDQAAEIVVPPTSAAGPGRRVPRHPGRRSRHRRTRRRVSPRWPRPSASPTNTYSVYTEYHGMLSATEQEAVAHATPQTSQAEEGPEARPRPTRFGTREVGGPQQHLAERPADLRSRDSRGTVRSRASPSTAPWSSAIAFTSSSGSMRPRRSTSGWRRSAVSRTRPPMPAPESRTRRRHPSREGRPATRGSSRQLAHREQGRQLLKHVGPATPRGARDHAMLAMLIGCGLRRGELLALTLESVQPREEHWVIADLVGKGGHVRTVPIPSWVKSAVDAWTTAAGITEGRVFRAINKAGRIWGNGMSPKVLWDVDRVAAARAGIEKPGSARPAAHVRAVVPPGRRRTRADPVSVGACLRSNYRAVPRVQTEAPMRRERPTRDRAGRRRDVALGRADGRDPSAPGDQ